MSRRCPDSPQCRARKARASRPVFLHPGVGRARRSALRCPPRLPLPVVGAILPLPNPFNRRDLGRDAAETVRISSHMVDSRRIGIAFSGGASPSEIVDCVRLAESLGYESAWVAEGHGGDQFAVLGACAAQTSRILLGTSITSVFVRTVPTIAMAALTVDDLSRGRFILGVGSSHKVQVEGEHGVSYTKPLTRVRETVELIRQLARDGRVGFHGETVSVENFDLWFTPRRRAFPIYVSAVFPKMAALCGEIADGIILTRSTFGTAARIRSHLAEGAARAGRQPAAVTVTSLLPTAVGETRRQALDALRPGLAFYAGFFPRYNRLI